MTVQTLETKRESWWRRRVIAPILAQLRQGITPREIALTIALGLALGIFPILGSTTALCAVAALILRLNQPVIQLVNYLAYPLQLALLLPFYRAGEKLFQQQPVPIFSVTELLGRFSQDPWQFVLDYGMVALYGITVWMLLAPLVSAVLFLALRGPLTSLARGLGRTAGSNQQ
jgi:uncharacterized protein (DUF2062 family)